MEPNTPEMMDADPSAGPLPQLRLGRSVRVELPWSSHPLPLSEWRIDDAAQLAALQALPRGSVRVLPADPAAAAGAPQPSRLSRHAQRVLAELQQLWTDEDAPGAPARVASTAPALAAAADDGVPPLDPLLCRRQLVEAAREALSLASLLSAPADELPADLDALRSADAVRAATRLARALAGKLTGVPSAYVRALCEDAEQRDFPHALHVAMLSLLLARAVGVDGEALHDLLLGALLHDVGQLRLAARLGAANVAPGGVLHEHHVAHGVEWGRRVGLPVGALRVLAQHHEQADGHGFPLRLPAARLDRTARIVALVNRYDNLCHPAPPAVGVAPHVALARLFAIGAAQFDVPLLRAFIRVMGVYPPGSLVQLSDARYARVVGVNRPRPLRPPVRVLGCEPGPDGFGEPLRLDVDPLLRIQRSLTPAQLPPSQRDWLAAAAGDPFAFTDAFADADAESVPS